MTVSYTSGALGATGRVVLRAQRQGFPTPLDSGFVNVTVANPAAAIVATDSLHLGTTVARELCLTVAAGESAAFECGDLRLVHPLPTVRTLGRARTPVLHYNHQHANPSPAAGAFVTVGTGPLPDSVTSSVSIAGVVRARGAWAGSAWSGGGPRRIASPYISSTGLAAGLHDFSLEVKSWYSGAAKTSGLVTGQLAVVSRRSSPFGSGWWLAGLERLDTLPGGDKLWTGGDGSMRRYAVVTSNVWAAPNVDGPDTLKWDGQRFVRELPHGVKVRFDAQGKHVGTVTRLGFETSFAYDETTGRLTSIAVPPATSGLVYQFFYSVSGQLDSVTAPGAGFSRRVTRLFPGDFGVVDSIRDPDGTVVRFQHGIKPAINRRIEGRTDRRGNRTTFSYDAGNKLEQTVVLMGTQPSIVTGFRPAETKGLPLAGAADTGSVYSELLGPRTDVVDDTRLWLDRFGAPRRIRDALGNETVLTRSDTRWPALVTRVRYPNGRVMAAVYDARGNVTSSTDSSTQLGGQYATTRYEWNAAWDFVSKIVPPMGDSTTVGYDPLNGNRLWQRNAAGDTVHFRYADSQGFKLLTSVRTPLATAPVGNPVRDSVTYDALGNVFETVTPLGRKTAHYRDRLGRDTLVTSPFGHTSQGNVATRQQRTYYDAADRDTLSRLDGPSNFHNDELVPTNASWAPKILLVKQTYDAEGNLTAVARKDSTDVDNIGWMTTRWVYDAANRQVREIAPDNLADSSVLDPSGNQTRWITRRGYAIALRYDALNRLVERITPAVIYPYVNPFPRFPNDGTQLSIAADTATFSYDAMDNMLTAFNRDARISRTFRVNGAMDSETQAVATYASQDFTQHIYTLTYSYDLNGRRVAMRHPSHLLFAGWADSTRYAYHAATGALASITNPLGQHFRFVYDAEQRLDSLVYPNSTAEKRFYDAEGRAWRTLQTAPVRPDSIGFDDGVIHDNQFVFAEDGTIIQATDRLELYRNWYTGLGAIAWQDEQYCHLSPCANISYYQRTRTEWFQPDALGNNRSQATRPTHHDLPIEQTHHYYNGAGRLHADSTLIDGQWVGWVYQYDSSGNQHRTQRNRLRTHCTGFQMEPCQAYALYWYAEHKAMYYGADERLRATDRIAAVQNPDYSTVGGFEEYRYDALGRRVLRRWRSDCLRSPLCGNASGYDGYVERYVHDGDQILYEIRSPGGRYATADSMEVDRIETFLSSPSTRYGRVLYTHGLGIDQALSVTRISVPFQPFITVFLHPNWRGQYSQGTNVDGTHKWCYSSSICAEINFASQNMRSYLDRTSQKAPDEDPYTWVGTFLQTKADATGQIYMRNRYFDPATGRFTQEDPIGLAGGMNLYGFGQGDPVNYSDPFGLCPEKPQECPGKTGAFVLLGNAAGAITADIAGFLPNNLVSAATGVGLSGIAGRMASTSRVSGLASDARQLHSVLHPIAQSRRTTAVLGTSDGGRIAASGGRDLTPAQRSVARSLGLISARMPRAHAEVTALRHAQQTGARPDALAIYGPKPICPQCRSAIESSGGRVTSPTTAVWP